MPWTRQRRSMRSRNQAYAANAPRKHGSHRAVGPDLTIVQTAAIPPAPIHISELSIPAQLAYETPVPGRIPAKRLSSVITSLWPPGSLGRTMQTTSADAARLMISSHAACSFASSAWPVHRPSRWPIIRHRCRRASRLLPCTGCTECEVLLAATRCRWRRRAAVEDLVAQRPPLMSPALDPRAHRESIRARRRGPRCLRNRPQNKRRSIRLWH